MPHSRRPCIVFTPRESLVLIWLPICACEMAQAERETPGGWGPLLHPQSGLDGSKRRAVDNSGPPPSLPTTHTCPFIEDRRETQGDPVICSSHSAQEWETWGSTPALSSCRVGAHEHWTALSSTTLPHQLTIPLCLESHSELMLQCLLSKALALSDTSSYVLPWPPALIMHSNFLTRHLPILQRLTAKHHTSRLLPCKGPEQKYSSTIRCSEAR